MSTTKGIILVAGNGTRLAPLSFGASKPLLPVYDKPMIYYPLSTLIRAGIKDILIITNEKDNQKFKDLLGSGKRLGINIQYQIQYEQRGIVDAFIIGKDFIGDDNVCLILGDNIFHHEVGTQNSACLSKGAEIYGYHVADPQRFGVAVFDDDKNVIAIEEKPSQPKSDLAVVGLYFFDNSVVDIAPNITPSARGELEITDVINEYIKRGECKLNIMDSDSVWMDVGNFDTLLKTSNYIQLMQSTTHSIISCPGIEAYKQGFIDAQQLLYLANRQIKSPYGQYIQEFAQKELYNNIKNAIFERTENRNKKELSIQL
ncbi:MAG: NTP transferase domain-containing protein [Clostridia bacterium]|nr:NTP transferase domain-containing protein [Clostridia bacterium]